MNDDKLSNLVRALDTAVESSTGDEKNNLHADVEQAMLRLHCLTNRLGSRAEASPYLSFLRRTTRSADVTSLAISA